MDGGDFDTWILESDDITGPWALVEYMKSFGPPRAKHRDPLFAARTLNATAPSRVTLSLRQENLRAACGLRREEIGPEISPP